MYGAGLELVPGTREHTAAAAREAAKTTWYASHCYNPVFFSGIKTFAYEACAQLGWKAPDELIVPVGNGTLVIGAYLGFADLLEAGIISKMPRITGVQTTACDPLTQAWQSGSPTVARVPSAFTLAEGIAIADPYRGSQILKIIRESGGSVVSVVEQEVKDSLVWCAHQGFCIEPTSAVPLAWLRNHHRFREAETVLTLFTGHGLKTAGKL
jgi:threonine synthase